MNLREIDAVEKGIPRRSTLRLLKLTIACSLFICLQVSAKTYSQEKISVKLQSVDLKKALATIERKSNYHFLYNDALVSNRPKVTLDVTNAEITAVLDKILLANGIGYRMLDNNLIVLKQDNSNHQIEVQQVQVSGRVTGTNNEPLAGVSITVRGTTRGTTTDANGMYSIAVPDGSATLVFSYVGYTTQEVAVNGRTTINISLAGSANQLDQVVVVGYGTQRKVDVTGSVSQVKGEDIAKQSTPNAISALQGKVAGVQITNSGQPGASPQIRIRGLGTVYGNQNPLYVVDGVWYDDIGFLNPADIENVSILKDASSEAIYGIRAANGVVLITTKKGKAGQAVISYNGYAGVQSVTNQVKMANATEYATLVNERLTLQKQTPLFAHPEQFGNGTDWYGVLLRNAFTTNHQVSVSGGSERSTYNFSAGYFDQQGIVQTNDFKRFTVRLQNDIQVFKALKIGYTAIGATINSQDVNSGAIFHQLFAASPVVPVYYQTGEYGDPADYSLGNTVANPKATLDFYNQKTKNDRFTGNAYADLKFARHFTLHSSIGGEYGESQVRNYNGEHLQPVAPAAQVNTFSLLTIRRDEVRNWILENTLTYDNHFGDHNLRVLIGQSAQHYQSYSLIGSAYNVPGNTSDQMYLKLAGTTNSQGQSLPAGSAPSYSSDLGDIANVASYFGRINYSFRNRYLINASVRADGSSKFSANNRWGYFPSVGLGWVISEEDFMRSQNTFNSLKLRGSWGKIGNASVPSNIASYLVTQAGYLTAVFGNPQQFYTGASVTQLPPPVINWERGVGTDVGIEGSLLKSKLYFEADWYNRKTEQAIFDIPILGSLGTNNSTVVGNQATFQNQGWEFTLTWKNNINNNLSYSVSGNIGINDNKVLSVTTGSNPIYGGGFGATGGQFVTRTILGQPIGEFYGLQVVGIFQSQQDITNYVSKSGAAIQPNARPGDFKYADVNGDGVIDAKDRVVLGNPNPKYSYGINTNWTFRQFDLTLDFQGVAGVDLYNANQGLRYGNENYTADFYNNRWHGQGTSNTNPSADIGGGTNYLPNSWYVQNGSYFRIRTAQLGYTLPNSLLSRWKVQRLRVYVNAQNPLTVFSYKGFSPEIISTNPTGQGIDTNVYPLYATYTFGVNLTF